MLQTKTNGIYGVVYLVTNTVNGKGYVGQTVQHLRVRWQRHCRVGNSGCAALANAIALYGADSFTVSVLQECMSAEDMNAVEAAAIARHMTMAPLGYNLRHGGGSKGRHSVESKEKMAEAHSASKTRAKHSADMVERWANTDYAGAMSEKAKARWENAVYANRVLTAMKLSAASPETKAKKSAAAKAHYAAGGFLALRNWNNSKESKSQKSKNATRYWSDPEKRKAYGEKMREKYLSADYIARAKEIAKANFTSEKRDALHKGAMASLLAVEGLARSDSASGIRGVRWHKGSKSWQSRVCTNGKMIHLGNFKTAEQAEAAYLAAKRAILEGAPVVTKSVQRALGVTQEALGALLTDGRDMVVNRLRAGG